jgi:hypothetical protein
MITTAMAANDWAAVAHLEPQLDAADQPRRYGLLPSALYYASLGLRIFPLIPDMKTPATRNGFLNATSDTGQIQTWWQRNPHHNIGIATGHLIDVIDIDGIKGVRTWLDNWDDFIDPSQDLGHVSTPRPGGTHIYLKANPDRRTRNGILPGIDSKASNKGYVVAPPSHLREIRKADSSIDQWEGFYHWRTPLLLQAAEAAA